MPRTYSFDHFQVQPQGSHRERPLPKSRPARGGGDGEIHYGKQFAQTEELYTAHEMEHELEELAHLRDEEKISRPRDDRRTREEPRKSEPAKANESQPLRIRRGSPIGALPQTDELHPVTMFREAFDEAGRHARAMVCSAQDLYGATKRLFALPFELAKLAAQRVKGMREARA